LPFDSSVYEFETSISFNWGLNEAWTRLDSFNSHTHQFLALPQ